MANILDLIRTRRSVREFSDRAVPDTVLDDVLAAGRLSPSGGNEQPWVFGVVRERSTIRGIAAASYGQDWIAGAPLVIVLCALIVDDERGGKDIQKQRFPRHRGEIEAMDDDLYAALNLEEHQTKIAGAHMVLVALEHGVGSTWVSRFDVEAVTDLLGLPDGCLPSELLVMGYPAAAGGLRAKKPIEELVFCDRWTEHNGRRQGAGESVDLLAYCGLYCGDCAGYSGDIASAARSLLDVLDHHKFERTARSLFGSELPDYERFRKALDFVSGLRCAATCREREEPCAIAQCCVERGFHGCYECDDFRTCDKLANLEDLHGDSCVLNIESIRKMGPEAWVAQARRLWFGSDVDDPPPSE